MLKLSARTTSAEKVLAAPTSVPFALPNTDKTSLIPCVVTAIATLEFSTPSIIKFSFLINLPDVS